MLIQLITNATKTLIGESWKTGEQLDPDQECSLAGLDPILTEV